MYLADFQKLKESGVISPKNIDVFCEKGVFEVDNSRKILQVRNNVEKLTVVER